MPSRTDFGDLALYASSGADAEETFLRFRTDIAGTSANSNFSKIANILHSHDSYIESNRRIFDVSAQRVSENYYESIDAEVTQYFPQMLILLTVSHTNTDSVNLNINSLGSLPIKKFNASGNTVNLTSGDLTANVKYLIEFVGEYFIFLNTITATELLEKIKTVDGSGSGLDSDLLDGLQSTDFATSTQGTKADSAVQSIKGNGVIIEPDENNCVNITPQNIGASGASHSHDSATTSTSGFMSQTDKLKLDGIANGATKNVITYGTSNPSGGSDSDIYFKYS